MIPALLDNLQIQAVLDNGMKLNSTLSQLTENELLCYANQVLREKKIGLWQQLMKYWSDKFGEQK